MTEFRWDVERIFQCLQLWDLEIFASVQHWSLSTMSFINRRMETLFGASHDFVSYQLFYRQRHTRSLCNSTSAWCWANSRGKNGMELIKDLSLFKNLKDVSCVNLDCWHYFSSIWSNWDPKGNIVGVEPPSAPSHNFVQGARSSRLLLEELINDEQSEVPHLLRNAVQPDVYVVLYSLFDELSAWYNAFYKDGYVVKPYLYVFVLSYKSV